jgi:hypothetical protein
MTSSAQTTNILDTVDNALFVTAGQEHNAGNYSAMAATLSALAMSSDTVIASIATAELAISSQFGGSATGFLEMGDYIIGQPFTMSALAAEYSSAVASTKTWTGSNWATS